MLVASACVFHRAMTFNQSTLFSRRFTAVLLLPLGIETVYHTIADEEAVHQLSFLLLIILVAIKTRALIKSRVQRSEDRQRLRALTMAGAGTFCSAGLSMLCC